MKPETPPSLATYAKESLFWRYIVGDTCDDLSMDGERLVHAATMLRTELRGEHGDVCGRLSEVPVP